MDRGDISSRIFVGGLDHSVSESDLEKEFQMFGEITGVVVLRDKETGRSRGFAFISFEDPTSSEKAISRMHGVEIKGRCVSVRHAEKEKGSSEDRPPRGRMRGGGYRDASGGGRGRADYRSSSYYNSNGYTGSHRGGSHRGDMDRGYGMREGTRGAGSSSSYFPRSRSPLGSYEDSSQPRGQRYGMARGYSPPTRKEYYSPPPAADYYGAVSTRSSPPPARSGRMMRDRSPSIRDAYGSYGSNTKDLSPARELNAYISSRVRDITPPLPIADYRNTAPPLSNRRPISPKESSLGRTMSSRREPLGGSSAREYTDSRGYGGSRDYSIKTRDDRTSANRGRGDERDYGSSVQGRQSRDVTDAPGRSAYSKGSFEERRTDSSRYGGTESRYSSSTRPHRGGTSPPMARRDAPVRNSRSTREHSPASRARRY